MNKKSFENCVKATEKNCNFSMLRAQCIINGMGRDVGCV